MGIVALISLLVIVVCVVKISKLLMGFEGGAWSIGTLIGAWLGVVLIALAIKSHVSRFQ